MYKSNQKRPNQITRNKHRYYYCNKLLLNFPRVLTKIPINFPNNVFRNSTILYKKSKASEPNKHKKHFLTIFSD